jgi:predicted Rossmann fold flavoprotein
MERDSKLMTEYSIVVVGGGAAGLCAAISVARRGETVVICEKTAQIGKKILASGDGRCNLLNENLSEEYYNPAARELVKSILAQFDKSAIINFFKNLGLQVYAREGRLFPVTNQAASVLKVLELELRRLAIPVNYNFACTGLVFSQGGIKVISQTGQELACRKVILTGGGKTYPAFGSDGSVYGIARDLGHTFIEPIPAVVPLVTKDSLCQVLQGQRISASARSIIEGQTGSEAKGELLFTKYGLSGTCILDISEEISIALNRRHSTEVQVSIDLAPFLDKLALKEELEKRIREKWPAADMLSGILPNKFGLALAELFKNNNLNGAVNILKDRRFKISATRGWNEAEFTSGGVNVEEINQQTLESRIARGVYFAGEVLDVNGKRGGYNLAWAWASGLAAGQAQ